MTPSMELSRAENAVRWARVDNRLVHLVEGLPPGTNRNKLTAALLARVNELSRCLSDMLEDGDAEDRDAAMRALGRSTSPEGNRGKAHGAPRFVRAASPN